MTSVRFVPKTRVANPSDSAVVEARLSIPVTETDKIVEDVLTERLIRTSPLLPEAYIPLPGAALQIDRPWSFEEMAALDYLSKPRWVTKMLEAAVAAEEADDEEEERFHPITPWSELEKHGIRKSDFMSKAVR
jgi:hypothetical protein